MSLNEICKSVKKYNNFLITAHTSPEGDALGSVLGFYNLVKKLDKRATIVIDDLLPEGYDFLPGIQHIRRLDQKCKNIKFDCLVVLDCAQLKRTGRVFELAQLRQPILNIDHHISNQSFGDVNWVDAQVSSCSELIYQLHKRFHLKMDRNTSLVLYTGIMTDTGSFRYSNTSSSTFKAAADLLKYGVDVAKTYRAAYENIPAKESKLLLKFLSKIKFFRQGKIATFDIDLASLGTKQSGIDLADHVLSFGRAIKGVQVVALFKYGKTKSSQVRVNLRSQGQVDVNKIAAFFQGGGHKTAAGCTISGGFLAVRKKVLNKIYEELK